MSTTVEASRRPGAARRRRYHHGDLREALINAAIALVRDRGGEKFSMADACRWAGVSTAAPYRHFDSKEDLLRAVVEQGFRSFTERNRSMAERFDPGSIESIIAMGQGYVAFARDEPDLFRLMFGRNPEFKVAPRTDAEGRACFQALLDAVDGFRRASALTHVSTLDVALPLWSIVHGISMLEIDGDFDKVVGPVDCDGLVEQATRAFLGGLLVQKQPGETVAQ